MIEVPGNMSHINALRALWERAQTATVLLHAPEKLAEEELWVATSDKVVLFFNATNRHFIDYFAGRAIKTGFGQFPLLIVYGYDQMYGEGAAYKALMVYNQIPKNVRFDKNDQCVFQKIRCNL